MDKNHQWKSIHKDPLFESHIIKALPDNNNPKPRTRIIKTNTAKIIGTFLGVFLLVGGLTLGVMLAREPQLFKQSAQTTTTTYNQNCSQPPGTTRCEVNSSGVPTGNIQTCSGTYWYTSSCGSGYTCSNDQCIAIDTSGCFLAGTKVSTSQGGKNIEDISNNDVVLSFGNNKIINNSKVLDVYKVTRDHYYMIKSENGFVKVTAEHPFYIGNGEYKEAKNLKINDVIYKLSSDNSLIPENITEIQRINEQVEAFNLTVDEDHTFFANNFAVHNKLAPAPSLSMDQICSNKYGSGTYASYYGTKPANCRTGDLTVGSADNQTCLRKFLGICLEYALPGDQVIYATCCQSVSAYNAIQSKNCGTVTFTSNVFYNGTLVNACTQSRTLTCQKGTGNNCVRSWQESIVKSCMSAYPAGTDEKHDPYASSSKSCDYVEVDWTGNLTHPGGTCCP